MDHGLVPESAVDAAAAGEKAAAHSDPHVRAAIAVLITHFPRIDETFILREITELERRGQPVLLVPIVTVMPRVIHEEAKPWVKRALQLPFVSGAIARSNAIAFGRSPLTYLRLLFRLVVLSILRPSVLVRTLALFPKSVHLAMTLPALGIRHVHAHFATHAATAAYIIAALSDITYSFTVHGPDVFVHRVLLHEKIANAKFIRAISLFNKAFLSGLYPVFTEGKIHVVHAGVNPDVYAEAAAAAEVAAGPIRLLSVAALTSSRGFPFLIDACARLAKKGIDFDCRIVGDGPLRDATEQWVAQHGLTERVHLLGAQPQNEVARLMGEADIFVLPSIIAVDGQMDGIPIALMEAMAAGKPVVASSISGIPELVQHERSGLLVDAAYAGRLADAVQRLADDPKLRARLGREGQATVRRDFDVRSTTEAMGALFDAQDSVNEAEKSAAERIRRLHWSRLNAVAVGIRRIHERADAFVAEAVISDGVERRDVIVRRPRGEDAHARARAEFEVLSTLRQSMGPESLDETRTMSFTVPRLLMFDEPNAALVVARADGKSLASLLRERALFKAGTWLRILQKHTRAGEDGRHILTALVVLAERDLELAWAADPALRRHRYRILNRMRELESSIASRPLPVVGQHGNYRPENVIIGERRVDVLDFGSYREGLPLEDVAQMLVHVELRMRRMPERFRRAFLQGWGGAVDEECLRLFTATKAIEMLARGGVSDPQRRRLRAILGRALA